MGGLLRQRWGGCLCMDTCRACAAGERVQVGLPHKGVRRQHDSVGEQEAGSKRRYNTRKATPFPPFAAPLSMTLPNWQSSISGMQRQSDTT